MEFEGRNLHAGYGARALREEGMKLTYTTDTRPTKSIVENADTAPTFSSVRACTESPRRQKKAVEYKHMTFKEAGRLAKEAEVKELWLTHYSPSLTRPEEFMDSSTEYFPQRLAGKRRKIRGRLHFEED